MKEIIKGQKVWVYISHFKTEKIRETTVKSIGPKYITLDYDDRIKFYRDTLMEKDACGVMNFIILDLEEYRKEEYYNSIRFRLRTFKHWDCMEREDLDKINAIIKDYE